MAKMMRDGEMLTRPTLMMDTTASNPRTTKMTAHNQAQVGHADSGGLQAVSQCEAVLQAVDPCSFFTGQTLFLNGTNNLVAVK
ncbi:MAG: hypothetical protein AAF736_09625 [Pseudomonadota bacterium]